MPPRPKKPSSLCRPRPQLTGDSSSRSSPTAHGRSASSTVACSNSTPSSRRPPRARRRTRDRAGGAVAVDRGHLGGAVGGELTTSTSSAPGGLSSAGTSSGRGSSSQRPAPRAALVDDRARSAPARRRRGRSGSRAPTAPRPPRRRSRPSVRPSTRRTSSPTRWPWKSACSPQRVPGSKSGGSAASSADEPLPVEQRLGRLRLAERDEPGLLREHVPRRASPPCPPGAYSGQ